MRKPRTARGGSLNITQESIVSDYRVAMRSRQVSLLGRKEVFTGKAKFGIFGDGKEVAQVAMARGFRKGDIRSGYYRDQTVMFALGMLTVEEFFAQLYAHADVQAEPSSAGRSMTAHFASRMDRAGATRRDIRIFARRYLRRPQDGATTRDFVRAIVSVSDICQQKPDVSIADIKLAVT